MSVKEVINTSYNMGVKAVFDALNDEIEDWSGIHKKNAEYLISIVENLFEDNLKEFV